MTALPASRRGFITGLILLVVVITMAFDAGFYFGRSSSRPERGVISCNGGDWQVKNIDFDLDVGSPDKIYRFFGDFCRGRA